MEEKEPFKIKFTTVLIIVLVLFAIIGILAFNLRRLEDTITLLKENNPEQLERTVSGVPEINDYDYFNENYKNAIKVILDESNSNYGTTLSKYINEVVGTVEIDILGDVYFKLNTSSPIYAKYGKNPKVLSDVIDFQLGYVDKEVSSLYFLHTDGTVSEVNLTEAKASGEIVASKIDGLSNIIKVIEIPTPSTSISGFVDINGNIYNHNGEAFE